MTEDKDINLRGLFAETAEEPMDDGFVDKVDRRVGHARLRRRIRDGVAVGAGLVALAALAPSAGFIAQEATKTMAQSADWSSLFGVVLAMPTVQLAGMALAAAAGAMAFVRVQE